MVKKVKIHVYLFSVPCFPIFLPFFFLEKKSLYSKDMFIVYDISYTYIFLLFLFFLRLSCLFLLFFNCMWSSLLFFHFDFWV